MGFALRNAGGSSNNTSAPNLTCVKVSASSSLVSSGPPSASLLHASCKDVGCKGRVWAIYPCCIAQVPIVAATLGGLSVLGVAVMAYLLRTQMQDFSDRIRKRSGPPTSQSPFWEVLQICQPAACMFGSLSPPRQAAVSHMLLQLWACRTRFLSRMWRGRRSCGSGTAR